MFVEGWWGWEGGADGDRLLLVCHFRITERFCELLEVKRLIINKT